MAMSIDVVRVIVGFLTECITVKRLQFNSRWYLCAQEGPYLRSIPSLGSFPNQVALETVPMLV